MNAASLHKHCSADSYIKKSYRGIFTMDAPPSMRPPPPASYILNTAESTDAKGEHWIVVYEQQQGPGGGAPPLLFDSFGFRPLSYGDVFMKWLGQAPGAAAVQSNEERVQDWATVTCGLYCLMALRHFGAGAGLDALMRRFSTMDSHYNEQLVTRYAAAHFGINPRRELQEEKTASDMSDKIARHLSLLSSHGYV